ncbi:MAG: efflux RND transporter permease subunit [Gracilibacteraceae bacterium]|jgi:multidrug efflux pump subunit AcrB|nr:efflux RND transporter permease subunit [Gracilibacteraceae bacterium]
MIKWCVRHKSMVALISAMMLIGGALSFLLLSRQENPSVTAPAAVVSCIYPGATPADVEKSVARPLEKELAALRGLKHVQSVAMPNVCLITVYIQDMSDSEIKEKYAEIKDCVSRAETRLPAEAEKPVINTDLASAYGLILTLSSPALPAADLRAAALDIESALKRIPGVTAADITGALEEEIVVSLDMAKIEQYALAPARLSQAVAAGNISLPAGSLDLAERYVPVRLNGEYESVADLREAVVAVSAETGLPVRLRDVAAIDRGERGERVRAFAGRTPGVLIGVKYAEDGNIVDIGRRVRAETERLAASAPPGVTLTVLTDQAIFTEEAITSFLQNFLAAVLLVVIVVGLVMGLRSAVIVSLPIALVVAAVLAAMYFFRIPLHQVSVASLIISLSLLVANGVVANDNIYLFMEEGRDPFTAATEGARQVAVPILTSTLTTVASFLPLALMQGVAGKFAYSLPILVTVALLVSLLTALTVVPACGHKYLKPPAAGGAAQTGGHGAIKRFTRFYARWLDLALDHPGRAISLFAAALALTLFLLPGLNVQVFPPLEREQYAMEMTAPADYTPEATQALAARVADLLAAEESVQDFAYVTGSGFPKYNMTFPPARQGAHKAEFLINGGRSQAESVAGRVALSLPDAVTRVKFLEFNMPQDYPIAVRVTGADIPTLRRIAEEMEGLTDPLASVGRTEIDYGQDSYELSLTVNAEKAAAVGVSTYDIAAVLRMAVNGAEATRLKEDDLRLDSVPVILRLPEARLNVREGLDQIFITSGATGARVPLRQLVRTETSTALNQIVRRDFERTITIGVFPAPGAGIPKVIADCRQAFDAVTLPAGYSFAIGGENEFTSETLGSMVMPAVLAVLIIYLILALQFGDLIGPLIIMGTIPLSFIGIICGLRLFGYPIGFMALLGGVSLMGVVVNNGIVLLSYVKDKERDGAGLREAVFTAGVTRLRPIMIGMVTTVISLIPMMLAGGTLWAPLATTVITGMLVSTLATMIVIPCLYLLIYRRKTPARQVPENSDIS